MGIFRPRLLDGSRKIQGKHGRPVFDSHSIHDQAGSATPLASRADSPQERSKMKIFFFLEFVACLFSPCLPGEANASHLTYITLVS